MIERLTNKLNKQEALYGVLIKDCQQLQKEYDNAVLEAQILEQVNVFLASQIKEKVGETKYKLESLVNQGLSYVFGNDLRIAIESAFKNNKTVFSLNIIKDGLSEGRASSFGGGVLAVVAILLRVSAIIITNSERFIFLDESSNFVSAQYQPALGNFLKQICGQLGFTIVLISHQETINQSADISYTAQGDPVDGIKFVRDERGL